MEDQGNDKVADVTVGRLSTIENMVDYKNRVNYGQELNVCILAEAISHLFGTFCQES